jgi:hypothetical protein
VAAAVVLVLLVYLVQAQLPEETELPLQLLEQRYLEQLVEEGVFLVVEQSLVLVAKAGAVLVPKEVLLLVTDSQIPDLVVVVLEVRAAAAPFLQQPDLEMAVQVS